MGVVGEAVALECAGSAKQLSGMAELCELHCHIFTRMYMSMHVHVCVSLCARMHMHAFASVLGLYLCEHMSELVFQISSHTPPFFLRYTFSLVLELFSCLG